MKNKKIVLDKSLLAIAKICKGQEKSHLQDVWIYPDNKIVSTDGFKLIEYKDNEEIDLGLFEKVALPLSKPIGLSSKSILKNQKFFKDTPISLLKKGVLIKGSGKGKVKIRTTDLDNTIDVEYRKTDKKKIPYESLFKDLPKFISCFDVNILISLLLVYKELGINEINLFQDATEKKPLLILNTNQKLKKVRGLVMPIQKNEEEALNENNYR